MKRIWLFVFLILFTAYFNLSIVFPEGGGGVAEFKAKLKTLRQEMAKLTNQYKKDLAAAKKEISDKIEVAKSEFHKIRSHHLTDLKNREARLKENYDTKMGPMETEEKELLNQIEPLEPNNFAKRRL